MTPANRTRIRTGRGFAASVRGLIVPVRATARVSIIEAGRPDSSGSASSASVSPRRRTKPPSGSMLTVYSVSPIFLPHSRGGPTGRHGRGRTARRAFARPGIGGKDRVEVRIGDRIVRVERVGDHGGDLGKADLSREETFDGDFVGGGEHGGICATASPGLQR